MIKYVMERGIKKESKYVCMYVCIVWRIGAFGCLLLHNFFFFIVFVC